MTARRVAIISGASSGIGAACANELARQGWRVYGGRRLASPSNGLVNSISLDVTDDASVRTAVAEVLRNESRIDLLVNNAGIAVAGALEETPLADARSLLEVNFFGAMRLTQAVLPVMRSQRSGLIVNMSSLGGLFGLPFQAMYSASKFALEGMSESLRHEVGVHGVDVVLVEPGDVRTNITRNRLRLRPAQGTSAYSGRFEGVLRIIEKEEQGGVAPETVARLVCRIADSRSRRARYSCGRLSQRSSAWARRVLPGKLFESIISGFYGLSAASAGAPESEFLTKGSGAS